MTKQKYRIGVIGAGARGETFARQLAKGHPRAELFGVCDISRERLETFCDYCQLPPVPRFTDTHEFLQQPELDAVIITTPEFTHAEVAEAALKTGKHIYLEKAMAQSSAACRQIIETYRAATSNVTVFLGFNMRAVTAFARLKEIVDSGTLGQLVHVAGLEQLAQAHGAAFMRRFHRHSKRSGGLLNTKCAHDLDFIQWLVGHQHKVVKVASFGGTNIFTTDKQPAKYCHQCDIQADCGYRDQAGFVFPVGGDRPLHHPETEVYGGDLCVYDPDKDLVDNQTVILEWDNGVRGSFNLQMFQHVGLRRVSVWGERGYAELNTWPQTAIQVVEASGTKLEYNFAQAKGGHGGSDIKMLDRFLNAIESAEHTTSGLAEGLAATLVAEKADQSRLSGCPIVISPDEYL